MKNFLKICRRATCGAVPAALLAGCVEREARPNIIFIFPDQMRNAAMGFWSDEEYKDYVPWQGDPVNTPNLDRMAEESVVFSRAHSSYPVSSPYRGMFLTGMYPEGSGIPMNCISTRPYSTLNPDAVCISDVLSEAGYNCGYIGKLHAEFPTPDDPENPGHYVSDRMPEWDTYTPPERRHGFDFWYSYGTFDEHNNPHYWDKDGHRHEPKEFSVKHEVNVAISYLRNEHGERDKKKPFFLVMSLNPPHSPYNSLKDCMEEDFVQYKEKSFAELFVRPNADTTMNKAKSVRYYFSNVSTVDRQLGRLFDEIKNLRLEENTIIVFTSDHGETMCSQGVTDPKNSIYSESFNVPFLIRWKGHIEHRVDSTLISPTDIFPTLLGLAGLSAKAPETLQGYDLASHILDEGAECTLPRSVLYIKNADEPKDEEGLIHGYFPMTRGIKTARHSLAITLNRDTTIREIQMFDDIADPYQFHNIGIEENSELYNDLCATLAQKLVDTQDPWHRNGIMRKIWKQK